MEKCKTVCANGNLMVKMTKDNCGISCEFKEKSLVAYELYKKTENKGCKIIQNVI
jgi:hypothetical protein